MPGRGEGSATGRSGDCMSEPVVTISPDASVDEAAQMMQLHRIRRLPVVDHNERCVGMVAQADLARRASEQQAGQVVRQVSQPREMAGAAW